MQHFIFRLNDKKLPVSIGNKAKNLRWLQSKRFRIPQTLVCTWDAYQAYIQDDIQIVEKLITELNEKIDPEKAYAVRSSANVEDDLEHSFAGQFRSVLNLKGVDEILQGIWSIWATTQSDGVQSYLKKMQGNQQNLKMAVIVQEMVPPEISGVSFSKNPFTTFDEVVIEAIRGSGHLLVQNGATPMRWVNKWGGWIEIPDNSVEVPPYLEEVVQQTNLISKKYGADVDLEWVYDGQNVYWLQVREITSMMNTRIYSNRISKEVTPGHIKPLVWSVNTPLANGGWVDLLTEVIGDNDIKPASLARSFHYRSYFDMGKFGEIFESLGFPRESLEMMMGIVPPDSGKPPIKPSPTLIRLLPRVLRFIIDKWTIGSRVQKAIPFLTKKHLSYMTMPLSGLDAAEILTLIDQFYPVQQETYYLNLVVQLLMLFYNASLKSRLESVGVDFHRFDLTGGLQGIHDYDPCSELSTLHDQWIQIDETTQQKILNGNNVSIENEAGLKKFQENLNKFLDQFGHLSDSGTDFSYETWRENPDMIFQMIASFKPPHIESEEKIRIDDLPVSGAKGWLTKLLYKRSRKFMLYREGISSLYTRGLSSFRAYYLALGERFVDRGLIEFREDIFFLFDDEIRACVKKEINGEDFKKMIGERQEDMENSRNIILPEVIFGDSPPIIVAQSSQTLQGTPTSRGYFTGPVKVVQGLRDFNKPVEGDVLVIPYSDVSWTPLFTKVGAVISESGGILSHSSIVAREYNIPAVVSVPGAMQMHDGEMVTVDGYKGKIIIHDTAPDQE